VYPKILELGPITIHAYGLLLAAAFIMGIWVTSRNAGKAGINPDAIWNMGLIVIFSALLGSKIILLFSNFQHYSKNYGEIFSLASLHSPGVYFGSLFLALGAASIYAKKQRLPGRAFADVAAPGIALGQAISRLGCLSAGCCYGKPTHLPWGITFRNQYAADNVGVPLNIPLHPTQIYEFLASLLLFLFLTRQLSRKHFSGQILLEFLGIYSVLKFFIEFFRDDDRGFVLYGLLSTSQLISIVTIAGCAAAYFLVARRSSAVPQN
jgi:phosphatidylglycerol---prolipoprotein diacylglyceryl transferase